MSNVKTETYKKIQIRFKQFNKTMRDIWESHNVTEQYLLMAHASIKDNSCACMTLTPLFCRNAKTYSRNNSLGAITSVLHKASPQRAFITAVSAFEDFLGDILQLVYTDFPNKISAPNHDESSQSQESKLLKIILDCDSREEIISRIIEEKIRSIFYGNPLDFFLKDKGKLEFGDVFKTNYKDEINSLNEILARRNIIIHNGARIDRKYLKEVHGATFKLYQAIKIDKPYLRSSIMLMEGLCASICALALQNLYKQSPRASILKSFNSFKAKIYKSI